MKVGSFAVLSVTALTGQNLVLPVISVHTPGRNYRVAIGGCVEEDIIIMSFHTYMYYKLEINLVYRSATF